MEPEVPFGWETKTSTPWGRLVRFFGHFATLLRTVRPQLALGTAHPVVRMSSRSLAIPARERA